MNIINTLVTFRKQKALTQHDHTRSYSMDLISYMIDFAAILFGI